MIKAFIHFIEKNLGFSKTESKGTLVLATMMLLGLICTQGFIRWRNYSQTQPIVEGDLAEWIAEVEASYDIKSTDSQGVTHEILTQPTVKSPTISTNRPDPVAAKTESTPTVPPKTISEKKDINMAKAADLQQVRGIGEVFSNRIVKYRNALGGFYDISQLNEVYGLNPETVVAIQKQFFVGQEITKIPINSDSIKVLVRHPYISYDLARLIVAYKKANGEFRSSEDLKKIKAIDDTTFLRLKPYID